MMAAGLTAGLLALLLTPIAALVARRIGLVDRPGPLKVQTRPVSYLGGIAVLIAITIPILWSHPMLLLPLGAVALLGLADDVFELSAHFRLGCEVVVGVVVAWIVVPGWHPFDVLLAVAAVTVLVNAVNLIDGLDGLAAGVAGASVLGFCFFLDGDSRTLAAAMLGALGGFVVWNRPPARIYLGDSGSYLIGTALAVLLLSSVESDGSRAFAGAPLLFVAVPIADAGIAIVRRWRAGAPLLRGDRGHIYDQLVDRGLSRGSATMACIAAQLLLVAIGLGIDRLSTAAAITATVICLLVLAVSLLVTFTDTAAQET